MKFDVIFEPIEKKEEKGIRIAVAMCSSRDIKPQTTSSLVNLVGALIHSGSQLGLTRLDLVGGVSESLLSNARQKKLDLGCAGPYTHIVWFDDDMMFPYDAVHRMIAHNVDFVCANACQKIPSKISGVCLDFDGNRIDSTGKKGLEEVGWGSLAVAVLKLDKIRKIPKPHFEVLWEPTLMNGKGGYQGEDHYFMKKIREHGIKIWCDHDLSQEVSHIGDYPYGFQRII